jgi:hypothetical protein
LYFGAAAAAMGRGSAAVEGSYSPPPASNVFRNKYRVLSKMLWVCDLSIGEKFGGALRCHHQVHYRTYVRICQVPPDAGSDAVVF